MTPSPGATGLDLPGYTILGRLGAGGAADVYLAREDHLQREVAIKVLRRDLNDPKQWRRLQREARTIARLSSHPHVVTVYTLGQADTGEPYLVSEYLDRGSLSDVIAADGPLPPERAAQVGVAVADALTAAHELGILHRDVKPGNVLLSRDGRIKLGDFGIARLLEAHAGTITDVIAFTPEHVAPEVLRGEPEGPASDVYGLASTVATAVLGRPLFERGPDERVDAFLARKVIGATPGIPAWVPESLAHALGAALDPDPHRRSTLPELRRDLAAAAASVRPPVAAPAPAPPTPPTERAPQQDGRRPVAAAAAGPSHPSAVARRDRRPGRLRAIALAAAVVAVVALVAVASGLLGRNPQDDAGPSDAVSTTAVAATAGSTSVPAAPAPTPAAPTTVPPTDSGTALVTAAEAETFLRDYYDAVAAGDYERTWAQLAPEFQTGTAISFDYYTGFWDDNDLEVGAVELVEADADTAVVDAELRWNGSDEPVRSQFTLRRDDAGDIVIAEQT